jgi:hypothetical protein
VSFFLDYLPICVSPLWAIGLTACFLFAVYPVLSRARGRRLRER